MSALAPAVLMLSRRPPLVARKLSTCVLQAGEECLIMSSVGDPRAKQRIITAALALLLLVCFGGPIFETIDHWDNFA